MIAEKRFKFSSFCLTGSASIAAAASGIAGIVSISLFAAVFAASWFLDTARLRRRLPPRFFAFAAIIYLCFAPVDRFLLSSDWQCVLLHAIWFAMAARLATRAGDNDWRPLYILGSIQWIPAAAQPTGTIFWLCFAAFIVSGISSLMLFELRRCVANLHAPVKFADEEENTKKNAFHFRAFFTAITGIAVAVTAVAIPLFFFFPRLPVKSAAPGSPEAASSFSDSMGGIKKLEIGRSGSAQDPDEIVMRVKTDVPIERLPYNLKWRGISFDNYDGRAWTLLHRREQQPAAVQGGFYKLEDSAMGFELLRQTFFMEETSINTIFAAHRALAVSAEAGFVRRDLSGNLFAQNPAQGKAAYVVVSDATRPDGDNISGWNPIPDDIRSTWTQLPKLDPRVIRLAREITHGYDRQYDSARAIETWLRSNYGYADAIPSIYKVHESGDPLTVFLFDAREGNCEHFATAMTVMLRAIGIPARMTSGFLAGEYNPIGDSWTVRRKHAHAWTEAWFPPYGWIEFDATPFAEPSANPPSSRFFANLASAAGLWLRENVTGYGAARQYSVISGFFTRVNQAEDRAGEILSSSAKRARVVFDLFPFAAASVKITMLIFLLIIVFGIFILRRKRRSVFVRRVFRRGKQNPHSAAADFYAETLVFLKARGFIPEKAQTPTEFARSLGSHPAAPALLDLTRF
ncbi:MAG: DUF3488 and transglutaminase-like domain-containing protein, partial [Acidobacteriota bacterium]|nr:DUF3488 and transglutaminase-like domain-containing protein [Acidobacteriota bacterium]